MTQDLFRIDTDGPVGTINGLRYGKLTQTDPPWEEVNAAWGHVAMGTSMILKWLRNTCEESKWMIGPLKIYRIQPVGSTSRLENRLDLSILPLFSNDGDAVSGKVRTGLSWITSFVEEPLYDKAMAVFVGCLKELMDIAGINGSYGQTQNYYSISGEKVQIVRRQTSEVLASYSVKFNSSSYDNWTKAMKIILRILAQLLSWFQKENAQLAQLSRGKTSF